MSCHIPRGGRSYFYTGIIYIVFAVISIAAAVETQGHGLQDTGSVLARREVLAFDFEPPHGGTLSAGGVIHAQAGDVRPRIEGTGSGAGNLTIITDPTRNIQHALHYLVTAQSDEHKARLEHYLYIAPMMRTHVSEFSIKLDADFTPVEIKRADGGPNWCILRQWHQSAPESPPISLEIKPGTNNVIGWNIIQGEDKQHSKWASFGRRVVQLNRWYHFRVRWNVTPPGKAGPDRAGCCIVQMSDRVLPGELTEADTVFRYEGPIGYSARSGHDGNQVREQQGIYQGPHAQPQARHGVCIDNVAIYQVADAPL